MVIVVYEFYILLCKSLFGNVKFLVRYRIIKLFLYVLEIFVYE